MNEKVNQLNLIVDTFIEELEKIGVTIYDQDQEESVRSLVRDMLLSKHVSKFFRLLETHTDRIM